MRQLSAITLLAVVSVAAALRAQSPVPPEAPAFEVASIKENKGTEMRRSVQRQPGGRFNVTNMPLKELIRFAYQVQPYQSRGSPTGRIRRPGTSSPRPKSIPRPPRRARRTS